ncbi:MAG: NADH-quinone oxidoreductase subunit L [Phycisphaerae bacterium]|nr:NADH-quinone oxidoreductase subunit L [Phycisphaerae bacterium]
MDTRTLAILIPLLPLAGSALVGIVGLRMLKDRSHWLVLLGVAASLFFAVSLFFQVKGETARGSADLVDRVSAQATVDPSHEVGYEKLKHSIPIYEWISAGRSEWLNVTFRVDPLTIVMLLTVLSVSTMVVMYSVGYMRDHHGHAERGYERFFAFLGLFVFSMCALVLAGNFLLLYLGWELVGLCSYLLIGFYYDKPAAAAAAKKAFLVNRIGDFGFGLGILLIYLTFGTLDYEGVFSQVAEGVTAGGMPLTTERITTIALLLFCGAMGKSAQLPLHVWLPDAMEGPTPVSALIHAATMVTAGVYMVARCSIIFAASPIAMWVVGGIGAATAIFAATIALTQFDMKRILAYSTLSQLGYMFLALGVGAFDSAVFHLYTHAFFKACLFLGAGSVMHAMAGEIDIRRFSGLRRGMPVTYFTFLISGAALAGVPLLAAFWSKDEIIHAALSSSTPWLGWIGLLTALLTAFYTFRMIYMAFHNEVRLPRGVEHAHESGFWMAVPLVVLAIGAVFAGYVGVSVGPGEGRFLGMFEPHGAFHHFLEPVFADAKHHEMTVAAAPILSHAGGDAHAASGSAAHAGGHWLMWLSAGIAAYGIFNAWYFYTRRPGIPLAIALASGSIYQLFYHKYYVDELYDYAFVRTLRRIGDLCYACDRFVINTLLWIIAALPRAIGFLLRGWQQGAMQGYALGMMLGLVAILWWVLSSA